MHVPGAPGTLAHSRALIFGALGLLMSGCMTEFNNPAGSPTTLDDAGLASLRSRATDLTKISVAMNPPGTQDVVVGLAEAVGAEAKVEVFLESGLSTLLGSATAATDGAFSVAIGDNQATSDQVFLVVTRVGEVSDSAIVLSNDVTAPAAPTGVSLTVTENTPGTNDTLSGAAAAVEASSAVRAYKESGLSTLLGSGMAASDGSFAAFSIGDNQATSDLIYVVAVDAAGNISTATSVANDTTAPGMPDGTKLSVTMNTPGTDDTISGAAGAAVAGTTVRVYKESALSTLLATTTAAGDGSFAAVSIGDNQATSDLVYVVAVDAAGNVSAAASKANDVTSPAAPSGADLSVTMNTPGTNDTLSGSAGAVEGLAAVRVYEESGLSTLLGSTTAAADGSFAAFSIGDNQATSDLVYVVAVDAAGNASSATSATNDVTAPSAPSAANLSVTMNTPGTNDTLSGAAGAVEGSATVRVYKESGQTTSLGSATAAADGSFSAFSVGDNQATSDLIYVVAVDSAGNASAATSKTNDVTAPAPPDSARLTVTMNTPGTNDTLSGTAGAVENSATVRVYEESGLSTLLSSAAASATDGSFAAFSIGDNRATSDRVYVVAVDAAGNPSTATSMVNDVTPPAFSGIDRLYNFSESEILLAWLPAVDTVSADGDITYGICESTVSGACATSYAATYALGANRWSHVISGKPPTASYYFVVGAMDSAGNLALSAESKREVEGGILEMDLASNTTCARFAGGELRCWGAGGNGVLGNGSTADSSTPVQVSGFASGATTLAAGPWSACAVKSDGTAWCWGFNMRGQLGDFSTTQRASPVQVCAAGETAYPCVSHLASASDIAVSETQGCAVTGGEVVCWGQSGLTVGLGDGTTTSSLAPVRVCAVGQAAPCASFLSGISQVVTGFGYGCALSSLGDLYCWGDNDSGQLGNGNTTDQLVPVQVAGTWISVSAFHLTTCGVKSDNTVWCWGSNTYGAMGIGSTSGSFSSPNQVCAPGETAPCATFLTDIAEVQVGRDTACARGNTGVAYCWGDGQSGQHGDGKFTTFGTIPVAVSGITTASALYSGYQNYCATLSDGFTKCWGGNSSGKLGVGASLRNPSPVFVQSNVSQVSRGSNQLCVLDSGTGAVKCVGSNRDKQLGADAPGASLSFMTTGAVSPAKVTAGTSHVCAIDTAGGADCWGANSSGELGSGVTGASQAAPQAVDVVGTFLEIAGGGSHTCGILDGTPDPVYCWGKNDKGQVGDNSFLTQSSPQAVLNLPAVNALKIASGSNFSCALMSDQTVWCWGDNWNGQLGIGTSGTTSGTAVQVCAVGETSPCASFLSGVTDIAAGVMHACAVAGGEVVCWGYNGARQLGDTTLTQRTTPVRVCDVGESAPCASYLSGVQAIGVGTQHTCALSTTGSVYCWGSGSSGQLGSNLPISDPQRIAGITTATGLSVNGDTACAILGGADLFCWGHVGWGFGAGFAGNVGLPVYTLK